MAYDFFFMEKHSQCVVRIATDFARCMPARRRPHTPRFGAAGASRRTRLAPLECMRPLRCTCLGARAKKSAIKNRRWPLLASTAAPCAASKLPRSRSRCTSPTACRASRWSASPIPRSGSRASASARRCRRAGSSFPHNKRVTVSLAPADLPKESGRFDLPIALGILAAAGQIDASALDASSSPASSRSAASCGRCTARWRWRSPCSARRQARRARSSCRRRAPTSRRSSAVSRCAAPITCSTSSAPSFRATPPTRAGLPSRVPLPRRAPVVLHDLVDVRGQAAAKRALEIAAAGQLSLLMVGPPGTGKSMLARRLAGLLPPLSHDEALESAAILSVAGASARRAGASACCARRTTRLRRQRWSAAARRRAPAKRRSRTAASSSSTSWPNSRAPRSRRCASRSRPAASSSRARRARPTSRPLSSSSRR